MLFRSYPVNKSLRPTLATAAYKPVQKHKVTPGIQGWLDKTKHKYFIGISLGFFAWGNISKYNKTFSDNSFSLFSEPDHRPIYNQT